MANYDCPETWRAFMRQISHSPSRMTTGCSNIRTVVLWKDLHHWHTLHNIKFETVISVKPQEPIHACWLGSYGCNEDTAWCRFLMLGDSNRAGIPLAARCLDTHEQQFTPVKARAPCQSKTLKKLTRSFNRNLQACKHEDKHACIDNFFHPVRRTGWIPMAKSQRNQK